MGTLLPSAFAEFESYAQTWCLATETERYNARVNVLHLLQLIYSLIMVAMAVEIMHQPAPVDAADAVMIRTGEPIP
jgi:hypothetical protein